MSVAWSNSIGATPTKQPGLKVFGVARLAGLMLYINIKEVCLHTAGYNAHKTRQLYSDNSGLMYKGQTEGYSRNIM